MIGRVKWAEFALATPELARLGWERFERAELCMLATLRPNGWPRVSPCELDLVDGELMLGMMWQSPKALDLLRDDRCALHSCTSNRMGTDGDSSSTDALATPATPRCATHIAPRSARESTGSRATRSTVSRSTSHRPVS